MKTRMLFGAACLLAAACITGGTDVRSGDRYANLQGNLIFDRGEGFYANGEYRQAIIQYRHFLDVYPDLHLADDASYRIAQSLEGLGERIEAADVYRAMGLLYPRSTLAPQSRLRAGEIFEVEGRWGEAVEDYRDAAEYDQTEPGKLAQARLDSLKARIVAERDAQEVENERRKQEKIRRMDEKKSRGVTAESSTKYLMEVILGEDE